MNVIENIKTNLTPFFEEYKIQKAILFGSFARGEETRRSDVDLILLQETDKRFWDRYDGLMLDLGNAIQGHAVVPLIYTPKEFKIMKERTFIQRAMQEGIILYECENHEIQSGISNTVSV